MVFRNYDSSQSHQNGNPISSVPKDVLKGDLIFNSKSGVRKKFKNKAVLIGFLNNISGFLSSNKWHNYFQKNPALATEQKFHLHGLNNLPEWVGDLGIHNLSDIAELELRKYDTKTRSITSVAIDFNCEVYVRRFAQTMELTRIFGEGVSKVVNSLITENTLSDYPFLFSAKFDLKKFPPNQIEYGLPIPKEKDIYFDLALKALKLKKKEVPHYNDYGFLTVAFKTQKELDDFKGVYKNTDKVQKDYLTQDVLTHPEILTQDLLGKNFSNHPTPSNPKLSP